MRSVFITLILLTIFMVPRTSTAASCTFTRLLYEGVQGIDVICLQNFLKTKGFFTGTPTGLYGPATKLSVANWQRASGVVATPKEYGLFGEQSRLLYAKQSAPAPSSPKTNTNTKTTTTKKKTATTTPVCTIKRTLTLKVVGDDVKCLQTYLKKNGYLTQEPNGMYGSSTKAAIVKWQTKNKVKVKKKDLGVFDKKSLSAYKRLAKGKKAGGGGGGGGGSSPSDTTAPTTPTNLLASDVTQTTLTLSWSASTDAVGVSGYKVYQDGSLLSSGITGTTFGVTGLTLNTAYSFTVLAYDAEGNLSSQSDALATTTLSDTTAPTTPGSPSFSSVSTTAITLSWTASTDAVGISGYRIYRGATQVGTTTLLTLTNSSLSSGTSYSYTIEAYDSAGNRSARSATTSTSTLTVDVTSPTAPGTPTFSGVTASSINLTWSSSTDAIGVSGYRIYRGASQVGTSTYATFADSELSASTAYSYTMEAYDATGNRSARSATTSTTTLAASDVTAPTTPGTIAFSDVSYTSITLRWSSSTDAVGVSGYRIYRGSSQVGTSTLALFTNTGLSTSTSYSYTVEAYDIAGNRSARNATTSTSTLSVVSGSAYYVDLSTLSGSDGIKLNGVRGSDSPGFNDLLGSAVARVGDINNDGKDDILVGALGGELLVDSPALNRGRAYVVYGSSTAGFSNLATSTNGYNLNLLNGNQGIAMSGPEVVNAQFSYTLSGGGDFNNDAIPDLLGAEQSGGVTSSAYVLYGDGVQFGGLHNISMDQLEGTHTSGADDVNSDGVDDGARFGGLDATGYGLAVANAGDVDNDGYDDILVGNAERDTGRGVNSGEVFLIFGGSNATLDSYTDLTATTTGVIRFRGQGTNDYAGIDVSGIGDVDNDGYVDFAIGATNTGGDDGRLYVVLGDTRANLMSLASSTNSTSTVTGGFSNTLNGATGFRVTDPPFAAVSSVLMGRMVASVGNWNGDVYDDFIVGLPGIGAAMVLYGSSTFASTTNATNVMDTQVGGFAIAAGVDDVRRAGDFNNDGYDDVILGEKESDEAYILFGTSNISSYISTPAAYGSEMVDITDGLSLSGSGANLQSGGYLYGKGVYIEGIESTNAGITVSDIGDVNGDGYDDVAVGATLADAVTAVSDPTAGQAYVIFGR